MKRVFNCNGAWRAGPRAPPARTTRATHPCARLPAAALCSFHARRPASPHARARARAGSIEEDKEMGEIIQLQGDQRDNARSWILENEIVARADAELVVVHGF